MTSVFSPEGLDLLSEAKVETNKAFDHGGWELEVGQYEIAGKVGDRNIARDRNFILLPIKFTNRLSRPVHVNLNTFESTMFDTNGEKMSPRGLVHVGSKTNIGQDLEPGESLSGLLLFDALKGLKPGKLKLRDYRTQRTATVILP
jgi:hypothetical protein